MVEGYWKRFFQGDNSSLTGIGVEEIAVSEGRFNGFTLGSFFEESKEYYDLAGAKAVFYQGVFRGLKHAARTERRQ
jgi:hypothetical protein